MKLGFVYDLRDDYLALGYSDEETAEFDSVVTIDAIDAALTRQGWTVIRVGRGQELARRFAAGERFDMVFSIAEGLKGRSREAQVPALCELYDQPYVFSDPLTMAVTLDKPVAKRIVRDHGVLTAPFAVIDSATASLAGVMFPAFLKPVAEGTGKGCSGKSRVETKTALRAEASRMLKAFRQPVLAETYLPGREFTVGVVGCGAQAKVIAVLELLIAENAEAGVYGFANKQSFGDHFACRLADDEEARKAADRALAAHRALGCRDVSRVDMRSDAKGEPHFLEVNPIPALKPGFSDIAILTDLSGRNYDWLMGEIMRSACARQGVAMPRLKQRARAA
ncbi:MAG: ATP-grasp domain-containing protein [Oricola sp.]|nr:ATP-grasp domain-containing protein [Oricola sp.]